MTSIKNLLLFVAAMFSHAALAGCPGGSMSTNWCWPTGSQSWTNDLAWHGSNPGFAGLHLAKDIDATEDDLVYAVGFGTVVAAKDAVNYYGGATNCRVVDGKSVVDSITGAGAVIRHYTSSGAPVDVLYAHLKELKVKKGSVVAPGTIIGKIRNYTWCGFRMDHLHLGTAYPARNLVTYERGLINFWAGYDSKSDLGFMDPVKFFSENSAGNEIAGCATSKERCLLRINGPIGWYPPVDLCGQASQWFNIATVNGEKIAVGSTTKAFCPIMCYAN